MHDAPSTLLFVYGTLVSTGTDAALLDRFAVARERATTAGTLHAVGEYTAATFGGGGVVAGELVSLRSPQALAVLDAYEGDEYRRTRVLVTREDCSQIEAWAYALAPPAR